MVEPMTHCPLAQRRGPQQREDTRRMARRSAALDGVWKVLTEQRRGPTEQIGQWDSNRNPRVKSRAQVTGDDGPHARALSAEVRRDVPLSNVLAVLLAVCIGAADLRERLTGRRTFSGN